MAKKRLIDLIQDTLAASQAPVKLGELQRVLNTVLGRLKSALKALETAGLVTALGGGKYQLTELARQLRAGIGDPARKSHPSDSAVSAAVWRTLRRQTVCTVFDIQSTLDLPDDAGTIRSVLSRLVRTGYVARMAKREPGLRQGNGGRVRYRLIQDTGPLAPIWNPGTRRLVDRNTGVTIEIKRAA
jgi:hypothetical protein